MCSVRNHHGFGCSYVTIHPCHLFSNPSGYAVASEWNGSTQPAAAAVIKVSLQRIGRIPLLLVIKHDFIRSLLRSHPPNQFTANTCCHYSYLHPYAPSQFIIMTEYSPSLSSLYFIILPHSIVLPPHPPPLRAWHL